MIETFCWYIVTLKKKVFAWLNAHGIIAIVSAFKDVHKVVRVGHSYASTNTSFHSPGLLPLRARSRVAPQIRPLQRTPSAGYQFTLSVTKLFFSPKFLLHLFIYANLGRVLGILIFLVYCILFWRSVGLLITRASYSIILDSKRTRLQKEQIPSVLFRYC